MKNRISFFIFIALTWLSPALSQTIFSAGVEFLLGCLANSFFIENMPIIIKDIE
jgi:hypothetical protein